MEWAFETPLTHFLQRGHTIPSSPFQAVPQAGDQAFNHEPVQPVSLKPPEIQENGRKVLDWVWGLGLMAADQISYSIWNCGKGDWRRVLEVRNLIQKLGLKKGSKYHKPEGREVLWTSHNHTRTEKIPATDYHMCPLSHDSLTCLLSRYCLKIALHSRNDCSVISWHPAPIK